MSPKKTWLAAGLLIVVVGVAGVVFWNREYAAQPPASNSTAPKPKAATKVPADPLTIEAMRSRQYPGSDITVEQTLSNHGSYQDALISYKSDGLKIQALQSTPNTSKPAAGWPVVILAHGYIPPTQYQTNSEDYREFIAAFTGAGFMVVKPDYRGHGQSQGSPESGHFAPAYAYDNLNLIASLKRYNQVDPKRIGLLGHSLGGHVALRTIVVSKDVKATVMMSGVVGSLEDLIYNWRRTPASSGIATAVRGARQALIEKYGDPKANPTFWNSASAIHYVDAVNGAVQIHHSEGDSVVPQLFSDHLTQALQKEGKPVEQFVYPGDDHQFIQSRRPFLERTVAFYQAKL